MTHPLQDHPDWWFEQPSLGIVVPLLVRGPGKKGKLDTIRGSSTCRETLVNNVGCLMQSRHDSTALWHDATTYDLTRRAALYVDTSAFKRKCADPVQRLPKVADYLLGICSVLLSPSGKWWKTKYPFRTEEKQSGLVSGNKVFWRGCDGWFLQHPATLALATGLLRQCYSLCTGGFGQQVLNSVSSSKVEEILTTGDQRRALALAGKLRRWIEVPTGRCGDPDNYAIPIGLWRRLIRLHRAVRRYGYEETLGQSFARGWDFDHRHGLDEGISDFWGDQGRLTSNHRRLMRLGAPRKGKR